MIEFPFAAGAVQETVADVELTVTVLIVGALGALYGTTGPTGLAEATEPSSSIAFTMTV